MSCQHGTHSCLQGLASTAENGEQGGPTNAPQTLWDGWGHDRDDARLDGKFFLATGGAH